MTQIQTAIDILTELKKDFKPDGIGGSCDCDFCQVARPVRGALNCSLAALKTIAWIKTWNPTDILEVRHIQNIFKEFGETL
jgi:hypothetical protein